MCQCECGNIKEVNKTNLTTGKSTCCGCVTKENARRRMTTHGLSNTKIFRTWSSMLRRCKNPNTKGFCNYGGRGITVCKEWEHNFVAFYEWAMVNGYDDSLELDRINVEGHYEPNNCRWVTHKQNSNNKRNTLKVEYRGEKYLVSELAEKYNIPYKTLRDRLIKYNFTVEDAIMLPIKVGNNQNLRSKK